MQPRDSDGLTQPPLDPVYLHARREATEILVAWAVALVWSVGYCSLQGYESDMPLSMVLGIPTWVFWGIVVPWALAAVFSCYYSLVRMQDDPLGEDLGVEPLPSDDALPRPDGRDRREA